MLIIPLKTPVLHSGDSLSALLNKGGEILNGDIVVISSKAVATVEGAMIDLRNNMPELLEFRAVRHGEACGGGCRHKRNSNNEAVELSRKISRSEEFCEAMLQELERLHGKVIGTVPGAALTELRPNGLKTGSILVANAGLDESNAPEGMAIGWPRDPVASVGRLRKELEERMWQRRIGGIGGKRRSPSNSSHSSRPSPPCNLALILTDSICMPRRQGVTAIALTVSGLDPLQSLKGKSDLFGKSLKITTEAVADQLATAANFVMGNAGQSIPAVIIRDHGLTLSEWEGWVPGITAKEDLFKGLLS